MNEFEQELIDWINDLDVTEYVDEIQKATLERVLELYNYYNPKE